MEKNEVSGHAVLMGREERFIQGFGGETCGKEATGKT